MPDLHLTVAEATAVAEYLVSDPTPEGLSAWLKTILPEEFGRKQMAGVLVLGLALGMTSALAGSWLLARIRRRLRRGSLVRRVASPDVEP